MNSLLEKLNHYNTAIESAQELIDNDNEVSLQHYIIYLKEQRRHIKTAISDENKVLNKACKSMETRGTTFKEG